MKKTFEAHAKLNLVLDITGKRPDGYHDIRSVMQTIELHDDIEIETEPDRINKIQVSCTNAGDFSGIKWDESNLVYKAADLLLKSEAMKEKTPVSVRITVTKRIPDGAGMGGGSADAAAVLNGLNEMLGLGLKKDCLAETGAKIGADIPFCIYGNTALCEGIGEIVTPLPSAQKMYCILLKPEISLSTKDMYRITDSYSSTDPHPDAAGMINALKTEDENEFFRSLGNFMEPAAVHMCPEINELRRSLSMAGAMASMMTGSGSTVFGLFTDFEKAQKTFERLNPPKVKKFISSFYEA